MSEPDRVEGAVVAVGGVGPHHEAVEIADLVGFLREHQRVAAEMDAVRSRVQRSPSAQMGQVPPSELGRSLDVRV